MYIAMTKNYETPSVTRVDVDAADEVICTSVTDPELPSGGWTTENEW